MKTILKTSPRGKKKIESYSDDELAAKVERLEREELRLSKIEEGYRETHLWEFFKPFRWQERCREMFNVNLTTLAPAPNGIGKTTEMVILIMSWLAGYEAWNPVDADYPGAIKHQGKWYKPSSLGIKPPVIGRLTGNDWTHHLGQTVVRELKKWFPMKDFETKNNTQGVTWFYRHLPTGSTLELMTHDQKIELFESWRGHFGSSDEPPEEDIYDTFAGRALTDFGGKYLILATPLTQAWMLDKLVLKNDSTVGVLNDLCCLDNEISYGCDDKILTEMGLSGKQTKYWDEADGEKKTFFDLIMRRDLYIDIGDDGAKSRRPDDKGESAEKFLRENTSEDTHGRIMELQFLRKAKNTDLDDKPSRFFGLFKKLVGLIFKEFNAVKHIVPDDGRGIPTNWIVTFQIDFHLGKPHAVAFYACSERNNHYCIHEVWENMTPEEIAYLIIRKKKADCWRIDYGEIDALSKGDDKYMKNRDAEAKDAFTIIEALLEAEGIELGVASKDLKSGYINIKSWLKGPNKIPVFYFLDSLQSIKDNLYGHIYEVQRLCYVDGEPEKKDNHFMECWYRYTNCGIEYSEPKKEVLLMAGVGDGSKTSGKENWMG